MNINEDTDSALSSHRRSFERYLATRKDSGLIEDADKDAETLRVWDEVYSRVRLTKKSECNVI